MGTSHLICSANQLTGFYMMATLAFNELREMRTFGPNRPTACISLRLSFNELNENFRLLHRDVRSKIHSFVEGNRVLVI